MTAAVVNPLLPKPREMWVELFSGDFEPRLQELNRLMQEAAEEESRSKRFGAPASKSMGYAQEYDAVIAEARASGVVKLLFRGAGMGWRRLKDEHPPRPDNNEDDLLGVNRATFFESAVRMCIVEPEFTAEQYAEFYENASSVHWDRVCSAAWSVNESEPNIPKSSAVSLLQQMSGEDSRSAESTGSTLEPSTVSR